MTTISQDVVVTDEPFWRWWHNQPEIVALMAPEPEPDPALRQAADALTQALTGYARQTQGHRLGALRHGKKPWNWRR
jgi:hypothetical protein